MLRPYGHERPFRRVGMALPSSQRYPLSLPRAACLPTLAGDQATRDTHEAPVRRLAWSYRLQDVMVQPMPEHIVIDGNNLLYAMHAHAPVPAIGRETLVKVVEHWARQGVDEVTLVFDGPVPRGGLAKQMTSSRVTVRFSAPATADDIIVSVIEQAKHPEMLRVVSGDTAIRHAAKHQRCRHSDAISFVAELFPSEQKPRPRPPTPAEKPETVSPEEVNEWLEEFGITDDKDEPFDGPDAMPR